MKNPIKDIIEDTVTEALEKNARLPKHFQISLPQKHFYTLVKAMDKELPTALDNLSVKIKIESYVVDVVMDSDIFQKEDE